MLKYDWDLIKFIKKNTKLPVIVKGIPNLDAKKAINSGKVDGVWISNHGGRMFTPGISSAEALVKFRKSIKSKKLKLLLMVGKKRK